MTTVIVVVGPPEGQADAVCARLRALRADTDLEVESSRAEIHLPGVVAPRGLGVGAITWEIATPHSGPELLGLSAVTAALQDAEVLDTTTLLPLAAGQVETRAPLIKRTLLLRVRPGTAPSAVERFEADLAAMPVHISTIRSWRLSRVVKNPRWTHAWEQEYETLDGLTGEYMLNPFHWTTVDGWFDAEVPHHIVEPELAHLFAERDEPWSRAEL